MLNNKLECAQYAICERPYGFVSLSENDVDVDHLKVLLAVEGQVQTAQWK